MSHAFKGDGGLQWTGTSLGVLVEDSCSLDATNHYVTIPIMAQKRPFCFFYTLEIQRPSGRIQLHMGSSDWPRLRVASLACRGRSVPLPILRRCATPTAYNRVSLVEQSPGMASLYLVKATPLGLFSGSFQAMLL